jgi:hypothetical protein
MSELTGAVAPHPQVADALSPIAATFVPPETGFVPWWLPMTVGLIGMAIALWLLVEALRVRRLSIGGVLSEKMSFVLMAVVCFALAAVGYWVRPFVSMGLTAEQLALASEVLVIVGMALMAAYFSSVAQSMRQYMNALTGGEILDAQSVTADASSTEDSKDRA